MSATTGSRQRPRARAAVVASLACGAAAIAVGGRQSGDETAAAVTIAVPPVTVAPLSTPSTPPTSAPADNHPGQHHHDHRSPVTDELTRRGSDDRRPRPTNCRHRTGQLEHPRHRRHGCPGATRRRHTRWAPGDPWHVRGRLVPPRSRAGPQAGATVIAAHISWQGSTGPFLRLGELEPGALVEVALADGATRRYQVVSRAQYGKLALPKEEVWRTTGPETLVLITCGGAFDREIRRYADNIVVTAVPIA